MRIAVVQPDIVWEDKTANYDRVQRLLDRGVSGPVDLIALPEMFATGFSMELERTAESEKGETLSFLRALAVDRGASVLAGFMESNGEKGRNTVAVFSPNGDELGRYVKMHPFSLGGEDRRYERGPGVEVISVGECTLAPLICYDLRFPEIFREGMARGADLFVVVANWPETRIDHFVSLLKARAIENLSFSVGVNRVGSGGGLRYSGRSIVYGPFGEVLADAEGREGVVVCDLDLSALRATRSKFGFLADVRADRYPFLRRSNAGIGREGTEVLE